MEGKLKFGFLALIIIIVQSILKIIGVIITGSLSFLSETIDTVIDIFFVGLTLYSLSISQKPADFEHMYGHAKIDSVGAMTQGIILINIYGFLIFNAIQAILNQTFSVEQPIFGLQLLIISILINFIFSLILLWQGRKRSSLSLRVQGLNLLQDSLRAILVIINFVFVIFWQIFYLDPIFSLILAIIIIFTSLKLIKDGINNLLDVNPVRPKLIEEIKAIIKNLQNVNEINQFRIRASGNKLFIEVNLRVEDHISIVHADEITKAIRRLVQFYFPKYDTESIIEMNPLTSEKSLKEKIINLIYSLIMDYPMILDIKNLNIFSIEKDYFLSFKIIVQEDLTLNKAHNITTKFENNIKEQISDISRIITHIEPKEKKERVLLQERKCEKLNSEELNKLKKKIDRLLRSKNFVKGYHGFEFWNVNNYCIIELHIFFDGELNISIIHNYISELDHLIREKIDISNLEDVILHSEPLTGRTDGILFDM